MRLKNKEFSSLFLVGPMGVGKTTVGKRLARELSLEFIDSDHEIEKRAGADISWIFEVEGESGSTQGRFWVELDSNLLRHRDLQ